MGPITDPPGVRISFGVEFLVYIINGKQEEEFVSESAAICDRDGPNAPSIFLVCEVGRGGGGIFRRAFWGGPSTRGIHVVNTWIRDHCRGGLWI